MSTIAPRQINFPELMDRLLGLLTEKEQDIIERRFSLGNKSKETLDKIGKSYSITRERVRQIESVAIKKLARISMDPSMRYIHDLAYSILVEHGKVMAEDLLVSQMLKNLGGIKDIDPSAMKLAMRVSDKLIKQERNQFFRPFWRTKDVSLREIKAAIKDIEKTLNKKKEVLSTEALSRALPQYNKEMIHSLLFVSWGFLQTKEGWGLKSWRFINPRSIKDKVLITLKEKGKPLHFTDIIHHVLNNFSGKKKVTPQAIHNELIRHKEFVLVGRGLYGLREWGLAAGTVCDVIKSVLREKGSPMKRQEIIEAVLKKRDIRLGTISLNLQKYPFFKRVGRAVYEYDSSLDNKPRRKRGRKPKVA
ncbi:hypothetical protein K9M59_00635 [Candidatus Gracilibacteria bacterium]|nr:hypothetical protein [Candidatus Gracilibacteria bacterium]MCF7819086.1 hypothetical protein [Candidatus Gracilibacteria bacterium]